MQIEMTHTPSHHCNTLLIPTRGSNNAKPAILQAMHRNTHSGHHCMFRVMFSNPKTRFDARGSIQIDQCFRVNHRSIKKDLLNRASSSNRKRCCRTNDFKIKIIEICNWSCHYDHPNRWFDQAYTRKSWRSVNAISSVRWVGKNKNLVEDPVSYVDFWISSFLRLILG